MQHTQEPSTLSSQQITKLETVQSLSSIILRQFFTHKAAVAGLCVISLFILIAIFADLIAFLTGLDPVRQNPLNRYLKAGTTSTASFDMKQSLISQFKLKHQPADVQNFTEALTAAGLARSPETALFDVGDLPEAEALEKLTQLKHPLTSDYADTVDSFSSYHVLGTDELGRDVLIRLIYGTRVSLGIGIMVAVLSTFIGLLIGSFAGYYGGIMDTLLMRFTDSMLALPLQPVLIIIAAIDLNKLPFIKGLIAGPNESIIKMVFILLVFSWMTTALLVRGSILSLREREFILAAKTLGARDRTIIFNHILPNVISPVLVSVTLAVGNAILFESALSFLGLGISEPMTSWGQMLNKAQELMIEAPMLAIFPGLLILATTISFNYLGDGLQDALDPKAVKR